ncbi:PorP/SprF family type IX secretion system membrane protein [Belliella aquatica]|uniref:Bacteroidetes-specific membrane protein n=1 Tax=Belliella aquatica TaxID=1323734 RepID=A0ABQ1MPG9_9BACT|nr:type IX secretion system membrane protein PorP/SprF [Belliella aquatica]MCH7406200.1 type IX secretion system membrane protein PorP/SprF [Belliella aquatica]GGC44457.1 hypothetical protein GCM10010993_23700 [Belliella aquatica]
MNRSYLYCLFFGITFTLLSGKTYAQDPQYSQYYAAPLYLNPAFTGAEQATRIGANYRNQWPGLNAQFTTFSAYVDTYLEDYNSGVGFLVMNDVEGAAQLRSTTISALYSYELRLGERAFFRPGFQASYIRRDIGFYESLLFANQIDASDPFGPLIGTNEIEGFGEAVNLLSLSFGGLFFTEKFWFGASAHHVNHPNQSFIENGTSNLPMKFSFHTGYKISLGSGGYRNDFTHMYKERYFVPTVNFKKQGPFEQLDVGAYLFMEPIIFGLWYRGLPYKPVEQQSNRDAIVMMVGFNLLSGLNMGYSYDYTVSNLGIQSGGAHEVSLSYVFPSNNQGKPRRRDTILPCPKF